MSDYPSLNQIKDELLMFSSNWSQFQDLANFVLKNDDFYLWSGSGHQGQHHYGDGGLSKHVWEVVKLQEANIKFLAQVDKSPNRCDAFFAALFHDIGKLYDYSKIDGVWQKNIHCRKFHHISRSALVWNEESKKIGYPEENREEVLHAILSHHGQRDWGSPVAPATNLAWLLHLCDGISARTEDCSTWDRYSSRK